MDAVPLTLDSVIDELVVSVYVSHVGLAERATAVAEGADRAGDSRTAGLARLVVADLHNRAGRADAGIAQAREILATAADRVVVAHAHAVIAGGLWRVGDNGQAVRHAYPANRMLGPGDPAALRVDHALILASLVNDRRIGGISHQEFRAAQELADASGAAALILANLNNWAWCSYTQGDLRTAAELAGEMRAYSEAANEPLNASCADTVARILLEAGEPGEALRVIEQAIVSAQPTDADAIPSALITLADIQRHEGNVGAALRTLQACREMAERDRLPDVDALALRMIAGCHADLGEFAAAYQEMVEFHEAWTVRREERSEVMARVAHAQFAVDEARRTTERFRDMAERDALTGLWNRRRSDAQLAALLGTDQADGAAPASAATDHARRATPIASAGNSASIGGGKGSTGSHGSTGSPGSRGSHGDGGGHGNGISHGNGGSHGNGRGGHGPVGVALLDLDHFKAVNDTFTHATGDEVLCRVADLLRASGGYAGRHGGEEFIVLIEADPAAAAACCERLRAAIETYDWASLAPGLAVTASVGLTALRPDDTAESVVRRADEHLYAAKRAGRNTVVADPSGPLGLL
ncbi:GGDEF domain-containing protein [Actinoplanes sp. RD1]|uniref:GGDEF domain-containing protein n=1 Tax=Actinoplanes sp. RD1 TaxID=3064538 RepID=UPI0027429C94|nr:GGDEF domain-containing protein [Actinoplanes sp. RD1]